jgi:hypothetical protein
MLNLVDNFVFEEESLKQILNLAIKQGATYQFSFYIPGNKTAGEWRGQIRDKYAQDGGVLLASFSFTATYDEDTDKTFVTPKIEATETAEIPYTKFQGIGEPTARNCHVYDIEYEENGTVPEFPSSGFVQVKPEVTI